MHTKFVHVFLSTEHWAQQEIMAVHLYLPAKLFCKKTNKQTNQQQKRNKQNKKPQKNQQEQKTNKTTTTNVPPPPNKTNQTKTKQNKNKTKQKKRLSDFHPTSLFPTYKKVDINVFWLETFLLHLVFPLLASSVRVNIDFDLTVNGR